MLGIASNVLPGIISENCSEMMVKDSALFSGRLIIGRVAHSRQTFHRNYEQQFHNVMSSSAAHLYSTHAQ